MKYGLNMSEDAALDLVSVSALVHRLDPGVVPSLATLRWRPSSRCGYLRLAYLLASIEDLCHLVFPRQ